MEMDRRRVARVKIQRLKALAERASSAAPDAKLDSKLDAKTDAKSDAAPELKTHAKLTAHKVLKSK